VARGSRTGGASVLAATSEAIAQLWTPGPEHPAVAGAGCALHTPAPPLSATPPWPRNHRRHRRQRVQRARAAGVVAAAPSRPRRVRRPRREAAQHGSRRSEVASPWEAALDGRRSRRGRPVGCGRSPAAGWAQAGPRPQPPAVAARRRRGCRAGDGAAALWTSGREWLPAVGAAWRIEKEVKEMRRIYI